MGMKKMLIVLVVGLVSVLTLNAQTKDSVNANENKAFKEGNVVVDIGAGFVGYSTRLYKEWTVGVAKNKLDTSFATVAYVYPVQVEYGFKHWFGLGLRYAFSTHYVNDDFFKTHTENDVDLVLNFHLVKTKRFDLPFSLIMGYSHMKTKFKDDLNTTAKSGGINNGFMLIPRYYFTDNFGVFVNLGWLNYLYMNVDLSDDKTANLNAVNNLKYNYGAKGTSIGIGVVGKF